MNHTIKIICVLIIFQGLLTSLFMNFANKDLIHRLENNRHHEVIDQICPTSDQCFPQLNYALLNNQLQAFGFEVKQKGKSSAIYNYKNIFAIKVFEVVKPEMLNYALTEINIGIKIKESRVDYLVPIEQCCSQVTKSTSGHGNHYKFYLRIPLYEMGSLHEFIENSENSQIVDSFLWAWTVSFSLIEGVSTLHSKDYMHRDLKLDNILMKSHYVPNISDFGFAKKVADLTETVLGTKAYLAPEVSKEEPYTSKIDIHNLGIMIFEIFNAKNFDISKSGRDIIPQTCQVFSNTRTVLSESQDFYCFAYQNLIAIMMHPDPKKRPTIEEVKAEFINISALLWKNLNNTKKEQLIRESRNYFIDSSNAFLEFVYNQQNLAPQQHLNI